MNIQALMQQAKKMQKDLEKAKEEVEQKVFAGKSSLVEVEVNGKKEVLKVKINSDEDISKEDIEMIEDMLLIALNDAIKKADEAMNEKLGKMSPGMPGLF